MGNWKENQATAMKTKFKVLNKTIYLDSNLICEYEEKVGPFNDMTLSYLLITLELTENMTVTEMEEILERAMEEDCKDSVLVKEILTSEGRTIMRDVKSEVRDMVFEGNRSGDTIKYLENELERVLIVGDLELANEIKEHIQTERNWLSDLKYDS